MQMVSEDNSSETDVSSDISEVSIPRSIRLIILLILDIPSLILTILILIFIFKSRVLRQSLHNHVIIALLFSVLPTQLIDIPFHIVYLSLGYVWPANSQFCLFWMFISIGIFDSTRILMGYAAVERHLLVFYDRWLNSWRRRLVLHYIPLFSVILYSLIFYLYVIIFPPCSTNFDYTQPWCSYPCYFDDKILSMFDSIANVIIPAFIVFFFSLTFLLRVVIQKRRLNLRNQWRKHRKMALQLLSISSLLIIFNLPLNLLTLAHLCGLSADVGLRFSQYAYFFTYFIPLLMPFICFAFLPEIYRKLIKIFSDHWRRFRSQRTNTVLPRV